MSVGHPLITPDESDRWGLELDRSRPPIHRDEYERFERDPPAFIEELLAAKGGE